MGLFKKEVCVLCGNKAGMLTREKLLDGQFICGDCSLKCGNDMKSDFYRRLDSDGIVQRLAYMDENRAMLKAQFHETNAITTGIFGKTKVISIDMNNGWWVKANESDPDLITFDQVTSWELRLDTLFRSENDDAPRCMPPRGDLPVCPPDRKINRMSVFVYLNHPYLEYVELDVMSAVFVSYGDIEAGYRAAMQVMDWFESLRSEQASRYAAAQTAAAVQQAVAAVQQAAAPQTDPYAEVKKLKELLDMGIISQQEFDAKKKQLLGL